MYFSYRYSDGVKKRIDRLTYKIREAERREKEALSFAEQIKKERDDLQTKFTKLDDGYVNEFAGRVKSELEAAKITLKNKRYYKGEKISDILVKSTNKLKAINCNPEFNDSAIDEF